MRPAATLRPALGLLAILLTAGCGSLAPDAPYYTQPPPVLVPPGAAQPANLVSVCYNRLTATPDEVRGMITAACRDPEYVRDDYTGRCTVSAPARVTFRCSAVDRSVMVLTPPFEPFAGRGFGINSSLGGGSDE